MIVCHCNVITLADIERVIIGLLEEEEWRLITPLQVYHAMGKRGRCCGCFPGVTDIIVRTVEAFHARRETPAAEVIDFLERLKDAHRRLEEERRAARERMAAARAA